MPPAGRRYVGHNIQVNRLDHISKLPGYVPRPLVFELVESWYKRGPATTTILLLSTLQPVDWHCSDT